MNDTKVINPSPDCERGIYAPLKKPYIDETKVETAFTAPWLFIKLQIIVESKLPNNVDIIIDASISNISTNVKVNQNSNENLIVKSNSNSNSIFLNFNIIFINFILFIVKSVKYVYITLKKHKIKILNLCFYLVFLFIFS